jgi:hypothetical protein
LRRPRTEPQESSDPRLAADRMLPRLANDAIDSTDPRDPIDSTDAPLADRPDPVPIPPTIGLAES